MESHQKCRPDLHFKRLLALFLSAGCVLSFSLQPDFLCSWTTPRTGAASELSPSHTASFSQSMWLVEEIVWPQMVRQVPHCTRAPEQ